MSSSITWKIGQSVLLNDGRSAIVRFIGNLHFTTGEWVGVELENSTGKNDGSAKGERYFECAPGHGIFLRPTMIARTVEYQSRPMPSSGESANAQPVREKSSNHVPVSAPSKSPSKALTGQRLARGPIADYSSQAMTKASVKCNTQPSKTLLVRPRLSMVSQSSDVGLRRQSSSLSSPMASRGGSKRISLALGHNKTERTSTTALSSSSGMIDAQAQANIMANDAARNSSSNHHYASTALNVAGATASLSAPELAVSQEFSENIPHTRTEVSGCLLQNGQMASQKMKGVPKVGKEVDELQIKLRIVEKKRQEDREKLKLLDRLQQDKEKFESVIHRLRAKYLPLQTELLEARKELSKADEKLQTLERNQAEHDSAIEMATLDREMAEEIADAYKSELEALKVTLEEIQLENDVLKEENEELGKEMSLEERTSKGWLQMEKENERLRQALLRLRELTQEQESELRKVVSGLENDVNMLSGFKERYEEKSVSLSQAQADIENLRSRLEAALGAEEMIEELTDKNMVLFERIEELQATVEDLQNLKELNDELEINHIEHGKQLQEAIDLKNEVIIEQSRKASQQSNVLAEQQYVIDRFRGLVSSLQSDLESMRASREITESEARELSSRTKAMVDLNLRLQSSVTQGHARTIDIELRNLDAKQAIDNLAIIQPFLPEEFSTDKDSIEALLQLKRIGFKADLIHSVIKEQLSGRNVHKFVDDLHIILAFLNHLLNISSFCDKIVREISTSTVEYFANIKNISHELGPVERVLAELIQTLTKDELRFTQASEDLQRSLTVLMHLSNRFAQSVTQDCSFDSIRRTCLIQKQMENIITALSPIELQSEVGKPISYGCETTSHVQKSIMIVSQLRNARTTTVKIINSLQDHDPRSLSLTDESQLIVEKCEHNTEQLFNIIQRIGLFHISEDGTYISSMHSENVHGSNSSEPLSDANDSIPLEHLISEVQYLKDNLAQLAQFSQGFANTVKISRPPPPWALRAKSIKELSSASIVAENDLNDLRNVISNAASKLLDRETALEEAKVKIELLENRAKDSSLKSTRIDELQKALEQYHIKADELDKAVQNYKADMATLAAERDQLRHDLKVEEHDEQLKNNSKDDSHYQMLLTAKLREIFPLRAENNILRAALKYLREKSRNHRKSTLSPTRCGVVNQNHPLLQFPLSLTDHRRGNTSGSEVPASWLAAPLISRQKHASYNLPAFKAAELFVSDSVVLPRPVVLLKPSDRSSRLKWQPLRSTAQWQLLFEEEKLTLWSQRWLTCTA